MPWRVLDQNRDINIRIQQFAAFYCILLQQIFAFSLEFIKINFQINLYQVMLLCYVVGLAETKFYSTPCNCYWGSLLYCTICMYIVLFYN